MATPEQLDLYRRVAALHIANIDQGFLSTLGPQFVALMYRAIDESKDSVLLVARANGRVVGFVAGGVGMGPIYRGMLRYWVQLTWALVPSAFSYKRVRRIVEVLLYSGKGSDRGLPKAELLSIAIDPTFRGQQFAQTLYRDLCDHFLRRGVPEFKIVVGAALAPAHKFYTRMGAVAVSEVAVHKGESSTVYVQELALGKVAD
jgi:ribosomal protein S18 acetylase RimI-like enzyme